MTGRSYPSIHYRHAIGTGGGRQCAGHYPEVKLTRQHAKTLQPFRQACSKLPVLSRVKNQEILGQYRQLCAGVGSLAQTLCRLGPVAFRITARTKLDGGNGSFHGLFLLLATGTGPVPDASEGAGAFTSSTLTVVRSTFGLDQSPLT